MPNYPFIANKNSMTLLTVISHHNKAFDSNIRYIVLYCNLFNFIGFQLQRRNYCLAILLYQFFIFYLTVHEIFKKLLKLLLQSIL